MAADLSGIVIAPPTPWARISGFYRKLRRLPIIPVTLLEGYVMLLRIYELHNTIAVAKLKIL